MKGGTMHGHIGNEIPFVDNKGNTMHLSGSLTVKDLLKMGVKDIRLMPDDAPIPDGWWRDNAQQDARTEVK